MQNKSFGTPLFQATLTVTLPDGSGVDFPVLWAATGKVIPQFNADEFDVVAKKLKALGKTNHPLTVHIALVEDSTVRAAVTLDKKYGLVPEGQALVHWVRARYPDDCAYLDEVPYPAIVYWTTPSGGVLRMPAHWLNTGEVRLRPPEKQLEAVMEMLHASLPGGGCLGYVVLKEDTTIVAAIRRDDEYCIIGPSYAFSQWLQNAK